MFNEKYKTLKVYIQKLNSEFADDWSFAAYLGFSSLGAKISFFEDIESVPLIKENIVVAYIEDTIKHFKALGVRVPHPLNIPFDLNSQRFLRRNVELKTLKKFKEETTLPVFVKPDSSLKLFPSGVITKESSRKELFYGINDDEIVLTSEVVDVGPEYRCFVHDGKLVGIKHYAGDITKFPFIETILEAIDAYKSAPIAYTIDFGILNNPYESDSYNTFLIECNDMWSVGNYGLDSLIYVKMLRDRWFQIIKHNG